MAYFASTPPPSDYIKDDPRMFFSYHPEHTTFQSGYLGVSPTTISGTLHVRFPEAVEAKNIILKFVGREAVEWVDLKKVRAEKIIIDKSIYLWQSKTEVGHELITDLDLPFEFDVPNNAYESFSADFGDVMYTLRATVNRKPKKKKTWCEVAVPILRWTIPDEEDLKPLLIKSHARPRKVPLSWQAILPQTFFDVNKDMLIKLRLTAHNPTLRIKKISAYLKTYVNYKVDDRAVSPANSDTRYSKHEIYGKDIMMTPMGPDTIFEANVVVKIPGNVPPTCQTKYITVKNEIQIKVTFERSSHHVLIIREILVGRNLLVDRAAATVRSSLNFSDILPSIPMEN
ncbi:1889_t:CDS:1 [Ambispora leptoticha]|uniref:1889_t:CDS:1 n=1 Tax=Ambispora leptoticha TaxID=144679 RepID=A0A9N9F1X8_9GLOM|nr:1889_t:CDS:1 [Ambispora leptoticha]